MNDVVEKINMQLIKLKPYIKYVGCRFEDILFDLKSLLFQNQMDKKMQNEEEDLNAMLAFEAESSLLDENLLKLINQTEITEATYHYQYRELETAYWKV